MRLVMVNEISRLGRLVVDVLNTIESLHKYNGRTNGVIATRDKTLAKDQDVTDLLKSSDLSIRPISAITGRSINTVRKVSGLIST